MEGAKNMGGGLQVGGLALAGRALLAPMAGSTDAAMRGIAERYGAAAAVNEMVTASGLARDDRETRVRLSLKNKIGPRVIQIAARDEVEIAAAARRAVDAGADWIDINMGCPCKRVTGGLAGAALMRDLDHAARLVAAATNAVAAPVSVKMRLGWDDKSRNAPQLARRVEAEGAKLVTVHARTREQFYSGAANWTAIAAVKQAVRIPVVANGDCASPQGAAQMLRESGADAVMIGRAALGQPWLVGDVALYLSTRRLRPPPSAAERLAVALEHLEGLCSALGVAQGLRHARKHLAAYVDRVVFPASESHAERRRAMLECAELRVVKDRLTRLMLSETCEAAT